MAFFISLRKTPQVNHFFLKYLNGLQCLRDDSTLLFYVNLMVSRGWRSTSLAGNYAHRKVFVEPAQKEIPVPHVFRLLLYPQQLCIFVGLKYLQKLL